MRLQLKFNPFWRRTLVSGDRRLRLMRCITLRIEKSTSPVWAFKVLHRRRLVLLGGLALGGFLLAAAALHPWLERQPHNQVAWFDLAAPWGWASSRNW